MTNKILSLGVIGLLAVVPLASANQNNLETKAQIKAERIKMKEQVKAQRADAKELRAQFHKEGAEYREARADWQKSKEVRQKYKNASKEEREKMRAQAPAHLTKAIDRMIARLTRVKTWIAKRGAIAETEKNEIVAQIDRDIAWLTAKKGKIDGASADEIKNHLKEVRAYWKNNRASVKKYTGIVLGARADVVIVRAEKISARISAQIAKLQAAGKDTTRAERLLVNFDSKIALSKDKIAAAKRAFAAAKTASDVDGLLKQGRAFMGEARTYLREARVIAKGIIKELKNQ